MVFSKAQKGERGDWEEKTLGTTHQDPGRREIQKKRREAGRGVKTSVM